jgi:hypothetical protein
MSYASYISGFLRKNGFGAALDKKILSVGQDQSNPSTVANVYMQTGGGHLQESKAAIHAAKTVLTDAGFEIPLVAAGGFKVTGTATPTAPAQKPLPGFNSWLTRFIDEKGLDTEYRFDVEGKEWRWNSIPLGVVLEACRAASPQEQAKIQDTLVKIDVLNGDAMHYFKHLAKGLAK